MASQSLLDKAKAAGVVLTSGALLILTVEGYQPKVIIPIPGDAPTACVGHKDPYMKLGTVLSDKQCFQFLDADTSLAQNAVLKSIHVPINRNMLDAYTSFTFNVGATNWRHSSVLRLVNEGKYVEACNFMTKYHYAQGRSVRGLVNRRVTEVAVCLTPSEELVNVPHN